MAWQRYSKQERAQIATEYDRSAAASTRIADRLAAEGKTVAEGIHRRAAQERREIAAAARESSDRLNEVVNG